MTAIMNTHPANPHTPRRKRHMFDPSRIKIGVAGGSHREDEQVKGNALMKRQWHAPWSLATGSPTRVSTTNDAGPVTKGTTIVTGTPPASSTTINAASTSPASKAAEPSSSTPPTSAPIAPSTSSSQDPTPTVESTSSSTTQTPSTTSTPISTSSSSPVTSIAAVTLSSLPSTIKIATALTLVGSSSSSSSSVAASSTLSSSSATASTAGAKSAADSADAEGLSSGGIAGIAIGAALGAATLGLLLLWAYKRFSRDRRNGHPNAYNRRSILQDRGHDHPDDNQWHDSDQDGYGQRAGYAGQYNDLDDGALVRQGTYNSGMGTQPQQMTMAHPYAATTYASYPAGQASSRTRDLTNGGVYTTYADFDDDVPDTYLINGSQHDRNGRDSPTDYYGHAMSSANTDMMIAAQYGDAGFSEDGHGGHAIGQAIASPYDGGMAITNGERATPQRVPINVNGNGPQIPPFSPVGSPNLFDSGLYADDQQRSQGAKQLSRKSSQAAPKTATGDQLLRQEYRDLTRAAQVEEPTTPTTATLAASGGFPLPRSVSPKLTPKADASRMTQLTPMPMPERYRHGQPLTTLEEVATPASKIQPLEAIEVDPFSDIPMMLPPARSSAESLALPLPRPGHPYVGGSTDTQTTGSYASAISQNAFSPDPTRPSFVLSSPGLSLPESPASFADPGRYRSPFARPSVPSAVSLHVPSPKDAPQARSKTSLDAGWAPASGHRLAAAAGLNTTTMSRPDHARSLSTATNVDDAYDGI